jgi:superoxide dismutase, Cu-Zn family
MRSLPRFLVIISAVGILLAAGCASQQPSAQQVQPPGHGPEHAESGNPGQTAVGATFGKDDAAVNYDKGLVPNGAKMVVAEYIYDGATTVTLNVRGLMPSRTYGAHAHLMPCGPKGDDAGAHFQHQPDPVKPSVDPNYANPSNEIWLDFTTDAQGNATTATTVPWVFSTARAGSVVIHAEATQTAPGKAGTAGARLACLSVGF